VRASLAVFVVWRNQRAHQIRGALAQSARRSYEVNNSIGSVNRGNTKKMAGTNRDPSPRVREKHPGGRPPLHGVRLRPFAFRMPPSMRDEVADLAARSSTSTNDVLLVALSDWLKSRPTPSHVAEVVAELNFAPASERESR